jgi:hypothetical protein
MLPMMIMLAALAHPMPYGYGASTVDINQGVYICDTVDRRTLHQLVAQPVLTRRRALAARLGCRFNIAAPTLEYQADTHEVVDEVLGLCYQGTTQYCDEQAWAVTIDVHGETKMIIGLWLDEDRD